jgi:hypothetical protein
MMLFGQTDSVSGDPATRAGILAIAILLCLGLWRLIRWLFSGTPPPDPWSDEVAAEIAKDDAVPLCHRCLAPHDSRVDFCPECGAPVGAYTNWLPYPYLFSIGHTLRIGASGDFRRSPLTIAGFLCLGIVEYALFAPVYWFMLLKVLSVRGPSNAPSDPPPGESPSAGE